jgi:hypothetical protein
MSWETTYQNEQVRTGGGEALVLSVINDEGEPMAKISLRVGLGQNANSETSLRFTSSADMRQIAQLIMHHADRLDGLIDRAANPASQTEQCPC